MGRRCPILPKNFAWQMKKYIYLFILSVISLNIIISPVNLWADEEADRKARRIMVDLLYQISQQLEDFDWKKIKDPVKRAVIGGRDMYTSKDYCPAEFGERRARIALVMAATAKDIADTLRDMQAVLYKGARIATRLAGYGAAVDGLDVILAAGNALSSSRTEGEFAGQYLNNIIPIIAGKAADEAAKKFSSHLSELIDKGGEVISIDEVFDIFLEDVIGAISQEVTKSGVEKRLKVKRLKALKNDIVGMWSERTNIKEFLSLYNREVNFKWTQDWVQGCSSDIFASMNIAKRYLLLNVITRCSCKENNEKATTYLFANRPRLSQLTVRAQINLIKTSADGYRFQAKIVDKSRKAQCCDGKKSKPLEFKPLKLLDGKHSEGQTVRVTIKRTKETERTLSKVKTCQIAGTYDCLGTNPDGSTYKGKVTITSSGENAFKVHWIIHGKEWYGSGSLTKDGKIYVKYTGAFTGDGTWRLMSDGSFKGVWRSAGGSGQGSETWIPISRESLMKYQTPQGRWSTSEGSMDIQVDGAKLQGRYDQDNGRLFMTLKGNRASGYWIENDSDQRCITKKDGSYHWGRAEFEFDECFRKFTGWWSYCESAKPSKQWTGSRD